LEATDTKMGKLRKVLQIPFMFLLLNWAAVAGLYYYTRSHQGFWETAEHQPKTPRILHSEHV
jgi:hypothetical protein